MLKVGFASWLVAGSLLLASCQHLAGTKGRLHQISPAQQANIDAELKPRRLGLFVGINDFGDTSAWPTLRYAAKDANDLAGFLGSVRDGRFDWTRVQDRPDNTTRQSILQGLEELRRRNASPQDTVVVYLSTHGTLAYDEEGKLSRYVVASDTREDALSTTALSVNQLVESFNLLPSQRKVLVLAFCHSGGGKSHLNSSMREELKRVKGSFFAEPMEARSEASVILSASSWGETAQEDERLQNDIYTHFFLEALRTGYDVDRNGAVTVSEAHEYASRNTYAFSHGRQRPTAFSDILGADPILLVGTISAPGVPVLQSFAPEMEGVNVEVDGVRQGSLPGIVPLPEGMTRLVLSRSKGSVVYSGMVSMKAGENLEAADLIAQGHLELHLAAGIAGVPMTDGSNLFPIAMPYLAVGIGQKQLLGSLSGSLELACFGHQSSSSLSMPTGNVPVDQKIFVAKLSTQASLPLPKIDGLSVGGRLGVLYFNRDFVRALEPGETGIPAHGVERLLSPVVGLELAFHLSLTRNWQLSVEIGGDYFFLRQVSGLAHAFLLTGTVGGLWRF